MKKAKKKEERVGLPKTLYIEHIGSDLLLWQTPAEALAGLDNDKKALTVGVYELKHMAQITAEVKVTQCGPSKGGR
jgi:hypothetical protein